MAIELHEVSILPVGGVGAGPYLAVARWPVAGEDRSARRSGQSAAVRELLAVVLAAVRGPEAGHWSLARETTGQPVLAGPGAPAVSLAHREAWLACALGSAGSLGVDIEVMQARDWAAVADSLFAASERAWLLNAGGEERCRRGYRLWTLKEAFLKANGAAAGFPLTELVFDTDGRVVACPNRCGAPQDWHSRHWQWSDAVSVALVWSANHAVPA